MKKIDLLWLTLVSEILVNLSAGWIAIGLAVPFAVDKDIFTRFALLTGNLGFAILSLVGAYKLRKKVKR